MAKTGFPWVICYSFTVYFQHAGQLCYNRRDTHAFPTKCVCHVHETDVVSETFPCVNDVHPMLGSQAILHTDELLEVLHAHGSWTLQVASMWHLQKKEQVSLISRSWSERPKRSAKQKLCSST